MALCKGPKITVALKEWSNKGSTGAGCRAQLKQNQRLSLKLITRHDEKKNPKGWVWYEINVQPGLPWQRKTHTAIYDAL